jgi:hypothetical protein
VQVLRQCIERFQNNDAERLELGLQFIGHVVSIRIAVAQARRAHVKSLAGDTL